MPDAAVSNRGGLRSVVAALVPLLKRISSATRRSSAAVHRLQGAAQSLAEGDTEWFDHEIDAHLQWPRDGDPLFLERGVLASVAVRPGSRVLDACCGDGFYARRFFAAAAREVVAVDLNEAALDHARRYQAAPNISYQRADIRHGLPAGPFDVVVLAAVLHHFDDAEVGLVLAGIRDRLAPDGVLTGYALAGADVYRYRRSALDSAQDLLVLLRGTFGAASVLETSSAGRLNLYFYAAAHQAALPFDPSHASFHAAAGRSGP